MVCGKAAPEGVGVLGLGNTFWSEEGVGPSNVFIAVLGRPVTLLLVSKCKFEKRRKKESYIPSLSAVQGFCYIVKAFTMASDSMIISISNKGSRVATNGKGL